MVDPVLTPEELECVSAQAAAEYPAECCGVVLVRGDRSRERVLFPCRNVQDELHAADPVRHPRDSRTAYFIDARDLRTIARREAEGWELATIYHSHIDAGAYFSDTDRKNAMIDGDPAYPEAAYVVVSVMAGTVTETAAYAWDPQRRDFVSVPLRGV